MDVEIEQATDEDREWMEGEDDSDRRFEQGAYDDPPPFVLCWPMQFAQYVVSESASA